MATSGSFNTSGYSSSGYPNHYIFSWSLASQSIEGNYSVINWSLSAGGGSNQYRYTCVKEKYVNVDGENHSNSTVQNTYNGTTPFSGTKTIYHNSDGTKSFSASAGGAFYYYGSYNSTGSGSWSLPTIPRQANITSAPDFNDEGNPTIGYQNQAGNSVSSLQACISLTGTADDIKYRDISKTGTSYTFDLTEAERNVLRNSIPTSNTRSVAFIIKTVIGGNTFYSTITKTFSIVNGNPIFNAGNISYIDSNDATYKVTQNRKQLVQNLSNLLVSITSAMPKKGASISKYEATINNVTKTITAPGDIEFGSVNSSSNLSLVVKVIDSRGNGSSASITVIFLAWILPSAIISLKRKNNYEDESYLTVDATYSSIDSKNKLIIEYQKKKTSDTNYSELTAIDDNTTITMINDKNFAWNFRIKLTDSFGTTTYNVILAKGQFIFFVDTKKLSVGINCFPVNSESLEINGQKIGAIDFDKIYPVGSIYLSTQPTNPKTLFGIGTWTQLKSGFIYATSNTSGTTGTSGNGTGTSTGSATGNTGSTALTEAQMPSHYHTVNDHSHAQRTIGNDGNINPWVSAGSGGSSGVYTRQQVAWYNSGKAQVTTYNSSPNTNSKGSGSGHAHTLNSHTHTIPYISVYIWKRNS